MRLDDTFKQFQRIAQQVGRAMHGGLELLHRLGPLTFSLECLKPAVLFFENGLFGIEHQTVRRIHAHTPSVELRTLTEAEFTAQ